MDLRPVERKLAAILAADVAGYSRLMSADEEGTLAQLKAHRRALIDPKIREHHGKIIKTTGDGMLVEFPSVVDAVRCAVEVQRGMGERNAGVPTDKRIEFRIGINLGDIIHDEKDIFGDGVNIAARLEGLAEPGGICVSQGVRDPVRDRLRFTFEDMGEQALKNIASPIHAYRVRFAGAEPGEGGAAPVRGAPQWRRMFVAAVLLIVAGGTAMWAVARHQQKPTLSQPDKPSVAVLPFDNLTTDPQWDRLAGGITEDVITDLSMSRDLFVIARNSTSGYKGKAVDPRQVGHELGVQYVLEGIIQVTGNMAEVTVQLIDSSTGRYVWSDRFERPTSSIFEIQKEVSDKVAARLSGWQGAIPATQRAIAHRKSPESLQAFEYFLLGMEHQNRANKEDNIKAQHLYERAIELDPHLARAYVGLAWTHCVEIDFDYTRDADASAKECLRLASTAVVFDPSDADAHAAVAGAYAYLQEYDKSETEINRAIALNPNNTDALMIYAYNAAWFFGQPDLGKERGERALRLNPINYPAWYNQAMRTAYYFVGEFDKALAAALRFEAPAGPDFAQLAPVYAKLGRDAEARKIAAQLLRLDPDWSVERFLSSWGAPKRDAELDLFVEGVRAAGLSVCASEIVLAKEPRMRRLPLCERMRAVKAVK